ncbi:MAG: hypothetical protein K2Q97_13045 [Burkholderiaceae bacterium]|nr:hypothetical protein [Burkholderiaceae bacterium]
MLASEKLAIAAHLHVLLRRKTGRVTDTEWMASNAEYAAEIIRFARASAEKDGHTDLGEWADKLEATMAPPPQSAAIAVKVTGTPYTALAPSAPTKTRYVRGLR